MEDVNYIARHILYENLERANRFSLLLLDTPGK